jgi:hypothetical protein
LLLNSSLLGTGSFAFRVSSPFLTGPARPSAPQVPGRSIPVAAGVDGGLGELRFRMMSFTDSLQSEDQAGLCFATARCNCSSWVLGPLRLRLRQRFALAVLSHCLCLVRCFAGQKSLLWRNSAQNRAIHTPAARAEIVGLVPAPCNPQYYTKNYQLC